MAVVKKATTEMIPEIIDLLLAFDNPRITYQDWSNLLVNSCISKENVNHSSYVLVDQSTNDRIVGFIGLIHSIRHIDGKEHQFCNLTSWIVKKKYRFEASKLLRSALQDEEWTLTNLSPTKGVHKLFLKFGFQLLEDSTVLLTPVTAPQATFSKPWLWTTDSKRKIGKRLEGEHLKIFNDHKNTLGKHLLLYNHKTYCYIISTIRWIRNIPCSWIHYISNPSLFFSHQAHVKWGLFKSNKTLITQLDSRFVGDDIPAFAVERKLHSPRLYRPARSGISSDAVDGLYSEFMWVTPP